jgi:hypothetical protein
MESRNFLQVVFKFCKLHCFLQGKSVKLQYCIRCLFILCQLEIIITVEYNHFSLVKRGPDLQHFFLGVGMSSYRFGKQFGNKPFKT